MTNSKHTKRALFSSVIALILCFSMLLGTTFAWFTDTVTSSGNKIQAGTLDIELMELKDGSWETAGNEPIFNSELWEPGYTDAHVLKVVNNGTLALKWAATITPLDASNVTELANVIDVYVKEGVTAVPANFTEVQGNYTHAGTLAQFLEGLAENTVGTLTAGQEATLGIVLHMQENAGNQYQGMSLGSDFDIRIYATQLSHESDSFGPDYDINAKYPANYEVVQTVKVTPTKDAAGNVTSAVVTAETTIDAGADSNAVVSSASVIVPAGATIDPAKVTEDDDVSLTVSIEENAEVPADITINTDTQDSIPLVIEVEGLAEDNTEVLTVYMNIGAGRTGLELYHTETNDAGVAANNKMMALNMQDTNPSHNTYYYNATSGELYLYASSFSPFTIVHDADPKVKTEDELKLALAEGGVIDLGANIVLDEQLTISGSVVLNLNGYELDASGCATRPFWIEESASLTINGNGSVKVGTHGLVDIRSTATYAKIVLNGGAYTAETANGAFVKVRGTGSVDVTLNDVTYSDAANNGFIVHAGEYKGSALTIDVNGGNLSANGGFSLVRCTATVSGAAVKTNGMAFECGYMSNVTVENCSLTVAPGVTIANAPAAAIAASNGGYVVVSNTTVSGSMQAAFYCYNSAGTIIVDGCTVAEGVKLYKIDPLADNAIGESYIQIDGAAYFGSTSGLNTVLANQDVVLGEDVNTAEMINMDGVVLDGNGKTIDGVKFDNDYDCLINAKSGVIQNVTIENAFRGIGTGSSGKYEMTGDLYIDNVTVDGCMYAMNIGIGNGYNLIVTNSTLYGWTSYSGLGNVEFTNVTFGMGNAQDPGYDSYGGYLQGYHDTVFNDCNFGENFRVSAGVEGVVYVFNNCYNNGTKLTAENFAALMTYDMSYDEQAEWLKNSTVIVDGVTVSPDTYH